MERRKFIQTSALAGLAALPGVDALASVEKLKPFPYKHILFHGDSITDGYHSTDNNTTTNMGYGFPMILAAELGYKYAEQKLRFTNRGMAGTGISDLNIRWQEDVIKLEPDLISILSGINDAGAWVTGKYPQPLSIFESAINNMLRDAQAALKNVRLVVCEPFVLKGFETSINIESWKKELKLRSAILKTVADRHGALWVPLQNHFDEAAQSTGPEYWLWDGIHPTPAGHELIAREWLRVVG